jgi:hypothetical protein
MKNTIFRDVMQCSLLLARFLLKASSILKMEAVLSSETSLNFYRTSSVTSQKVVLFIITAVRPSNPTRLVDCEVKCNTTRETLVGGSCSTQKGMKVFLTFFVPSLGIFTRTENVKVLAVF